MTLGIAIAASIAFGMIAATFIVVVLSRPNNKGIAPPTPPVAAYVYTEAQSREFLTQFGQEVINSATGGRPVSAPAPTDFLVWYFAVHGAGDNVAAEMVKHYGERCRDFAQNVTANT